MPARVEHRASSYTDAVVDALVGVASGDAVSPAATAALEAATGLVSRIFLTATVTARPAVQHVLTPSVLSLMTRNLMRRGESVHVIDVTRNGRLRLTPAGSWDLRGDADQASWYVRTDLFGPSSNVTRFVPYQQTLFPKYAVDSARPYQGIGPLQWARLTGRLHAEIESALTDESAGPRGFLLPLPVAGGDADDEIAGLKQTIKTLAGRVGVVETTAGSWGRDPADAPKKDYKPERVGASPPDVLATLRTDTGQAVLGALGTPIALFDDSDGTSKREAWRQLYAGTIKSLAAILVEECEEKLDTPVRIMFDAPAFEDRVGRSVIANRLAGIEGVTKDEAFALAGLS